MEAYRVKKTASVKIPKTPREMILPSITHGDSCEDKCKWINNARLIIQSKTKIGIAYNLVYDAMFNQLTEEERKQINYQSVVRVSNAHYTAIEEQFHISVVVFVSGKKFKFHYPTTLLPCGDQFVMIVDYGQVERLETEYYSM